MRFGYLAPLFASVAVSLGAVDESLSTRVRAMVEQQIGKKQAVGVSIAVARGNEILMNTGIGLANLEHRVEAGPQTVYRIGSITKQFTAAGILLLAERGDLSLDDRIDRHLPDQPKTYAHVTLRQLLNHTSGIKSFTSLPSYPRLMQQRTSTEEIVARFRDLPLEFPPGSRYRYNNSGYFLLGLIIEKVSAQTYADFLRQEIFKPLEMVSTRYEKHGEIVPNRAAGYRSWMGKIGNSRFQDMSQPYAAGALISTVGDLVKWQRALAEGRLFLEGGYGDMVEPGVLNNGRKTAYGLGIQTRKWNGRSTWRHGGGISGFRSELLYLPELDLTFAVLANCEQTHAGRLAEQIARLVMENTVGRSSR